MNRLPLTILFLLLVSFSYSHSALFVQLYSDDQGVSIDTTDFPNLSAKIKAYDNGKLLNLDLDNFYIVEDTYASRPFEIKKVEDDFYEITWSTKQIEFIGIESADIYVKYGSQTKKVQAGYYAPQVGSFIMSKYNMGNGKSEGSINGAIYLGEIEPITRHNYYFCIDVRVPLDSATSDTDPFMLDSITVDNDLFKVEWLGTRTDQRPLPIHVTNERYIIKLSVTPVDYNNISTELVFHYEPGIKKSYLIVANKLDLEVKTTLNLLKPNGNEVFAPCEEVEVKWKGHIKHLPVHVSYSTDGGSTWQFAGKVVDSTYIWKVPNIISETVLLKVHQEFSNQYPLLLEDYPYKDWTLAYDNSSSKIVSIARAGKINIYDLVSKTLIESKYLGAEDDLTYRYTILGAGFTDDNNSFVVAYNDANNQVDGSNTYFSRFTMGKEEPDYTVAMGRNFNADEMYKDNTSKYAIFRSNMSSTVMVFNLETGSFIKEMDLKHPIISMEVSRKENKVIVHNLNNEVNIYSLPDFTVSESFKKDDMPISYEINISPNGRFAFLAKEKAERASGPYFNDLMNLNNGDIVGFTEHNYARINEIQFNPLSTTAAIATSGVPQVSFFDLKLNAVLGNSMSIGGASVFDFQFAPDGHSIVSSMKSKSHINVTFFEYPEYDESDNYFAIRMPEFDGTNKKDIPMHLIAEEREYSYSDFCNKGQTKLFISDAYFQSGRHFSLVEDFAGDTVYPGECLSYKIIVNPKDVGLLNDTLIFTYCESEIKIPFVVESQNRHLGFDNEPIVMAEEVCVGDSYTQTFKLFTNLDPIPIKINDIDFVKYPSNYEVISPLIIDTIINPGQSLTVEIQFTPSELGINADSVKIIHSDAEPYYIPLGIQGTGIGAFVEYSHSRLPFVPELPERELQIINTGATAFSIQDWYLEPENSYEVLTALPITIAPGDTQVVRIRWNGDYLDRAQLSWDAEPCLLKSSVELLQFKSNYKLSIPAIETGPLQKVTIPLEYTFTQNSRYKGKRDFISEIKLYKRLFKPESVSSDFGEASILEEKTDEYFRYIKVKVHGDFDTTSGVAANIVGYPGVADVIETEVAFSEDAPQWGANTEGSLTSGSLTIIGVGDRRLLTPDNMVTINKITPNPGSDIIEIDFENKIEMQLSLQILDNLGQEVLLMPPTVYSKSDNNSIKIDCSQLPQGNYTAVLKANEHVASKQLIIIR